MPRRSAFPTWPCAGQDRYRPEQPLAVAEVEPKLLQIGISQVAQDVAVDAVLCERLHMMAKPVLSEPARDVEHAVLSQSSRTGL
jgi:hypothetical protein